METNLKVLFVDAGTSFYRINHYKLGNFFGPVDLGLHLSGKNNSLNISTGLLAGSIFPGSNRLIFTGFSPCWGGFFISSMGGAGLVFDNLGINMGKYYMYYGQDFITPRELGKRGAARLRGELLMDNLGMCRFHWNWAEEMMPEIIDSLYGLKQQFIENNHITASRINSRNSSVFWEPDRNIDIVYTFLKRKHILENNNDTELIKWMNYFEKNKHEAALSFWYEMHKGIQESLREF